MRTLQATLSDVSPGFVVAEFPFQQPYTQQHGFMHAGIVSTLLDSACGYAAFSLMPAGAAVLTVDFRINLLAPAKGERFLAEARVVKPGRTLTFTDGQLFAMQGESKKLVATMACTIMALHDRKDLDS